MSSDADSQVPVNVISHDTVNDTVNDTVTDTTNDTTHDISDTTSDTTNDSDTNIVDAASKDTVDAVFDNKQEPTCSELSALLESQTMKTREYETKLQHALADYENLLKKTQIDIKNGINTQLDKFLLDFIGIYDDFIRAKESFTQNHVDTQGLDAILKNMDTLLKKYDVSPIDALGEIFDPTYHEAISDSIDPELDDGTIVEEIRKGYISQSRVIRPTLVKISKRE